MDSSAYPRMKRMQLNHWWFAGRRDIFSYLIQKLPIPADARILEAGCGTGTNLPMLSAFGTVDAFDPEDRARAIVLAGTGISVAKGSLPDEVPFAGPYDLICAFDVIEHIDKDMESLQNLLGILKPGGRVLLTVPAFRFLWSRQDDLNHHKRRYTRHALKSVMERAGYQVDLASYYNFWLFPVGIVMRVLRKIFNFNEVRMDTPFRRFLNKILYGVFASEKHLLGRIKIPFGISIIAIGRKPLD